MNKKIIFLLLIIFSLISCASKSSDYQDQDYYDSEEEVIGLSAPEITEDFLGDFNPILLKSTVVLVKSMKKFAPKELYKTYLIPTNNTVEIHFRYGANQTCIILNQTERNKIINSAQQFLSEYEEKTLEHRKPSKKNCYYNSVCPLYFGIASDNNGTNNNAYYASYEIANKHAYYLLNFSSTRVTVGEGFTPTTRFYLSPSQLRDFLEILDQDYLNEQVKELREKAYTY